MGRTREQAQHAAGVGLVGGFAHATGSHGDDGVGAENQIVGKYPGDGQRFGAGQMQR